MSDFESFNGRDFDQWVTRSDLDGECPGCGDPVRHRGETCSVCRPPDEGPLLVWVDEWVAARTDPERRAIIYAAAALGDNAVSSYLAGSLERVGRWDERDDRALALARGAR